MVVLGIDPGTANTGYGVVARRDGRLDEGPQHAAWLRSMRDDRETHRRRRSVLDTVMIVSVLLAILVGAVWFLAFAGSPLPS